MAKSTHLIEEYSASEHTILCVCGWKGGDKEFRKHQLSSPPTDRKPSPDKYKGSEYATNTIVFGE